MSHVPQMIVALAMLLAGAANPASAAEPLFTLAEDGRTFVYRARPGDNPAAIADMFGIPAGDVPAFLAANGIADATRIATGFTFRIPNTAARELAERASALQQDNARLRRTATEEKERAQGLVRAADDARAAVTEAEARLGKLEQLWPWAKGAILMLVLVGAAAGYTTAAAVRRQAQADRYARSLARELEEKRRLALAERQESARRILELETRLRGLENQIRPRVVVSGR
jgi:hypothetical protein